MVAHTGYAWACSPVFAGVLTALLSLFHCPPRTAPYYCRSSALLYGLLYCNAFFPPSDKSFHSLMKAGTHEVLHLSQIYSTGLQTGWDALPAYGGSTNSRVLAAFIRQQVYLDVVHRRESVKSISRPGGRYG